VIYPEMMFVSLKRVTLLLTLAMVIVFQSHGQHPELAFDHYNVEDGLSQSTIWNIFEDSKGFMWFCTPDGLNKFDGYSFTIYRHIKSDSNSIQSNHPFYIFEDSEGDLWIGHQGGLSKYHYRQDRFTLVYRVPEVRNEEDGLLPLHESDERVWAWDKQRGIIGFNKSTLKEEINYPSPEKLVKNSKADTRFGKVINNKAFISTTNDLLIVFDFSSLTYSFLFSKVMDTAYQGISATNKFAIDSLNNLWIPGNGGLIYLDTKTLKSTQYTKGFSGLNLTSCALDKKGMLWIGSITKGLYIMDIQTSTVTNISKKNYSENGLLYNYIESLFIDSSGNIWIGTNGFGIQKFSKHKNKFDHFDLKIGTNVFGGNLVKAIAEDEAGNLYVGTFGNGLYVINKNGEVRNFSVPQNNNATGLTIGFDQDVLISNDFELFILRNDIIHPLQTVAKRLPSHITSITQTDSNDVLITSDIGVLKLSKNSHQYQLKELWTSAKLPLTSVLYKDSKERIWIGSPRSFYLLSKNDSVPRLMDHVTKNYIKSFSADEQGNIWIATVGELICYNPETDKADYLNEKDGFINTFFYAALPGNDKKIWVSSNQGLASYNPQDKTIKNFTVMDGLQSNEFNTGAFHQLKDGRLVFGGLNGINIFDPTSINVNSNLPKIAFTNFMVDDQPYSLDTSIIYKKRISLRYSQNIFSFEFSGLEYTSPKNNHYMYMLKGHDKDWVQGGNRRFVRYSRIAPGQYEFKVKASNSDDVWNEEPASTTIVIRPPIYLETWFIISLSILVVTIIALISIWIVRARYQSRLRHFEVNHKIQLERERISRDLHDNVGSQLTFIINQLDDGHPEIMMKEQLSEARDTARLTMSNLRETIWALHREPITVVDFTDRVKEFAMKQTKSKLGMHLNFSENLNGDYMFNPSKALNLFRIIQEVINNVVKHSEANILTINVELKDGVLKLLIADNGKGFSVDKTERNGYGLRNIIFRAEEMGATFSISSLCDKGTTILLSLAS
jgi:signal transduction histidine kinase/ligand-binding sensor domain-containing protein